MSHGFATLWLTANLPERVRADPPATAELVARGAGLLGALAREQAGPVQPDTLGQ